MKITIFAAIATLAYDYLVIEARHEKANLKQRQIKFNYYHIINSCSFIIDSLESFKILVVQFVNESRFANCEFANLFFDFDELQF